MTHFKFQKTLLAVSASVAMAGMLVNGQAHAQVNTEKGSIDITARIITSTCVLNLDSTASSAATSAKKSIDLGTFSLATASATLPTFIISKPVAVVLSLKEANGTAGCAAISAGKWDVSIDLPATAISTTNLSFNHSLNNTTTGDTAATGISVRLLRQKNSGASVEALLLNKVPGFGYLLSGSTTGPDLNSTDTVTVTAEMYRNTVGTLRVGTYTASVPLTVVYK